MMDDNYFGSIGGMLGKDTELFEGNLPLVPLCEPQIPHDLTRVRTQTAAVGSQRLTARVSARHIKRLGK
jgi:hypothetical protein